MRPIFFFVCLTFSILAPLQNVMATDDAGNEVKVFSQKEMDKALADQKAAYVLRVREAYRKGLARGRAERPPCPVCSPQSSQLGNTSGLGGSNTTGLEAPPGPLSGTTPGVLGGANTIGQVPNPSIDDLTTFQQFLVRNPQIFQ
ncbi:MAG: hypothetical protein MI741_10760, partial [Rhodospirillales bacterium]|nr:hypothetical protein [Rhodospirillales bacterium]